MLRGGADRFWSMMVMCAATAAVCAAAVPFLPLPAAASWPYVVLSGLLHIGYMLFLVQAYRTGDLGQTYPIARGSSPLLVALGAMAFAGERVGALTLAGILLVSGGIVSLAFKGRRLSAASIPAALGTGCFIGAYSVTDGIGVRLAGDSVAYTAWMCLAWGAAMPPLYLAARGPAGWRRPRRQVAMAVTGGIVSLVAYGVVVRAMRSDAMGSVSALRETSVVFAALIGRVFLKEKLTLRRVAACIVIACGAVCLGIRS